MEVQARLAREPLAAVGTHKGARVALRLLVGTGGGHRCSGGGTLLLVVPVPELAEALPGAQPQVPLEAARLGEALPTVRARKGTEARVGPLVPAHTPLAVAGVGAKPALVLLWLGLAGMLTAARVAHHLLQGGEVVAAHLAGEQGSLGSGLWNDQLASPLEAPSNDSARQAEALTC